MKTRKLSLKVSLAAIFMTCVAIGTVHAQVPGVVPDLSIWVGSWFRVRATETVYHFEDIGVKPTPAYPISQFDGICYVKITNWDTTTPGDEFLVAEVYVKESGSWIPSPVETWNIYYFAGSDLKFIGSVQLGDRPSMSLTLFLFKGKRNKANTKFIMDGTTKLGTIGGLMFEIDDVPGSTERWAGTVELGGPMVPVSKLPSPLQGQ